VKEYKIIKEDGILITVDGSAGDTLQYIFAPDEEDVKIEVDGSDMWITVGEDCRLTLDNPVMYERMGWITEK